MSGYYYPSHSSPEDEEFDFNQPYTTQSPQQTYQQYAAQPSGQLSSQRQYYAQQQQYYTSPQQYQYGFPTTQAQTYQTQVNPLQGYRQHTYQSPAYQQTAYQPQAWSTPVVPSNYPYETQPVTTFPQYTEPSMFSSDIATAGPSRTSTGYLSPSEADRGRAARAASDASSVSQSDVSRNTSPNASEMAKWGYRNENGTWSCRYPGCSSRSTFNRGCDLRKHYKRHTKTLFCRHEGCPQSREGGFSSKKDLARHEAKHNPNIACEWEGCDRLFSRVDNMKDHVRRMHMRKRTH